MPARKARTVRWRNGRPLVTDGPFIEAKESVGGFGVIDVPDLETALEIASTWPAPGHAVEVRPLVGRDHRMDTKEAPC